MHHAFRPTDVEGRHLPLAHQRPRAVLGYPAGKAGAPTPRAPSERRAKKDRRRRIDPTTFEKQYTDDELEFMNAMQRFKMQSGKSFPSHGEVLRVAFSLGYRKAVLIDDLEDSFEDEPSGTLELPPALAPI